MKAARRNLNEGDSQRPTTEGTAGTARYFGVFVYNQDITIVTCVCGAVCRRVFRGRREGCVLETSILHRSLPSHREDGGAAPDCSFTTLSCVTKVRK